PFFQEQRACHQAVCAVCTDENAAPVGTPCGRYGNTVRIFADSQYSLVLSEHDPSGTGAPNKRGVKVIAHDHVGDWIGGGDLERLGSDELKSDGMDRLFDGVTVSSVKQRINTPGQAPA